MKRGFESGSDYDDKIRGLSGMYLWFLATIVLVCVVSPTLVSLLRSSVKVLEFCRNRFEMEGGPAVKGWRGRWVGEGFDASGLRGVEDAAGNTEEGQRITSFQPTYGAIGTDAEGE
jgi:hypothetical protein